MEIAFHAKLYSRSEGYFKINLDDIGQLKKFYIGITHATEGVAEASQIFL
jgi:hypothetical protein